MKSLRKICLGPTPTRRLPRQNLAHRPLAGRYIFHLRQGESNQGMVKMALLLVRHRFFNCYVYSIFIVGPKRKGGSLIRSTPSLSIAEGPKTVDRRLSAGSASSSSELSETEEESEKKRSSTGGEQWNWLKEESGLYYLDAEALDVLQKWLHDLRLPVEEYLKLFISQGFDNLQTIALLKEDDIAQIGITKIGHRKKIMFWAQNHRPPHYEELMNMPDYDPSEDQDLHAMNNFTSWIDYNTSNSAPLPSPRPTSNSTTPSTSPSSAPTFPTSLTPTSPSSSSTTTPSTATVNNKPKAKTKDK